MASTAAAATSTKPTTTTVATTKVAYGASKYPNLTSIGYDMAKAIDLSVSDNKEMTISTTKLPKDDKSFIANAKAFWANEKTGDDYKTDWRGFAVRSANMFSVGSWEKYGTIEAKFADTAYFEPLDYWLRTSQYYSHEAGTIYGH